MRHLLLSKIPKSIRIAQPFFRYVNWWICLLLKGGSTVCLVYNNSSKSPVVNLACFNIWASVERLRGRWVAIVNLRVSAAGSFRFPRRPNRLNPTFNQRWTGLFRCQSGNEGYIQRSRARSADQSVSVWTFPANNHTLCISPYLSSSY